MNNVLLYMTFHLGCSYVVHALSIPRMYIDASCNWTSLCHFNFLNNISTTFLKLIPFYCYFIEYTNYPFIVGVYCRKVLTTIVYMISRCNR